MALERAHFPDSVHARRVDPRFTTSATALVLLAVWTLLLLSLPYSATLALTLKVAVWGLPALLVPRLVDHVNPGEFLSVDRVPAVGLAAVASALLFAYFLLVGGGMPARAISAFYLVSAVLVSPIVEEMAFRGLVLGKLAQVTSFGIANTATALLFALYHLPLWIARGASVSVPACLWVVFFSLAMGLLLRWSKSLWTCVVVHAVQNLLFGIL